MITLLLKNGTLMRQLIKILQTLLIRRENIAILWKGFYLRKKNTNAMESLDKIRIGY